MANPPGNLSNLSVWKPVTGSNPAANGEVSETVPAGKTWLLTVFSVTLVQGATQTPLPTLTIDDGSTVFYSSPGASSAQNASVTTKYTWAPQLGPPTAGGANTSAFASLPYPLLLLPGYRIKTVTAGIGANSDYAAPVMYVCEFG